MISNIPLFRAMFASLMGGPTSKKAKDLSSASIPPWSIASSVARLRAKASTKTETVRSLSVDDEKW